MFQDLLERSEASSAEPSSAPAADAMKAVDGVADRPKNGQERALPSRRASDAWLPLDRELARAHRVASGRLEQEDLEWLCRGFNAFLGGGGKLSLQRCLRLPTNEPAVQRAHRDHWLRRAWLLLDDSLSAWRRSELLAAEVQRFQCSKWTRWSHLAGAPASASALDAALFQAFRVHDRVPATAMQLHNIAGQSEGPGRGRKAKPHVQAGRTL